MSTLYEDWIGREERFEEEISVSKVQAMAATLDWDRSPQPGEPLPAGWHWLFFNPVVRRSQLGLDGHPRRGGFLPPIENARRMWAGSRISYLSDLPVGALAQRVSSIQKIEHKVGRTGALWFVTVSHRTFCDGVMCISEEQDIVYREVSPGMAKSPAITPAPQHAEWSFDVVPDPTLMFRYSALTFNGHRIHYDLDYAQRVEEYPNLVMHGPLTATFMQQFCVQKTGRGLASFEFRGVSPLFSGQTIRIFGRVNDRALDMWASGPGDGLAMTARGTLR